jgi:hypothetical protein
MQRWNGFFLSSGGLFKPVTVEFLTCDMHGGWNHSVSLNLDSPAPTDKELLREELAAHQEIVTTLRTGLDREAASIADCCITAEKAIQGITDALHGFEELKNLLRVLTIALGNKSSALALIEGDYNRSLNSVEAGAGFTDVNE